MSFSELQTLVWNWLDEEAEQCVQDAAADRNEQNLCTFLVVLYFNNVTLVWKASEHFEISKHLAFLFVGLIIFCIPPWHGALYEVLQYVNMCRHKEVPLSINQWMQQLCQNKSSHICIHEAYTYSISPNDEHSLRELRWLSERVIAFVSPNYFCISLLWTIR